MSKQTSKQFYADGLMDLGPYALDRVAIDSRWDALVDASRTGTIFSKSAFLAPYGDRAAAWICVKGKEPKALVCGVLSEDLTALVRPDPLVYGGVMPLPSASKQTTAQIHAEEFRCTCAIVNFLSSSFDAFRLFLSPGLQDIRPFQWLNYGTDDPKCSIGVRFTSLVQLEAADAGMELEQSQVYAQCNKSRRQEIRKAVTDRYRIKSTVDLDRFLDLYLRTFQRQGIDIPTQDIEYLSKVLSALSQQDDVRMVFAEDTESEADAVAVFGLDAKRAYYLYGGGSEGGESAVGTAALWRGIGLLAGEGCSEIDLEGVNSPKRGYYKLSFGGTVEPYFTIKFPE